MKQIPIELLQKPKLWQRSELPFWDDEYISKQMLEAHLDPSVDAASRKPEFIAKSVEWLATVIPQGAQVLDLGCGPGLYGKRLAEVGYKVTGVDYSRRSIAYAKQYDAQSTYVYANYLEMDYTDCFDAVLLIYADYAALTQDERTILLSKVRRAMKSDAVFVFDVFTDNHYRAKSETKIWSLESKGGFWSDKPYLCLTATYLYGEGVYVDRHVVTTEDNVADYIVWDTCFTEATLTAELTAGGFSVKGFYADVAGSPMSPDSDTLCCVATKAD